MKKEKTKLQIIDSIHNLLGKLYFVELDNGDRLQRLHPLTNTLFFKHHDRDRYVRVMSMRVDDMRALMEELSKFITNKSNSDETTK